MLSRRIPREIYFEIFLKLPAVRSLLTCKSVCKPWYALISSPDFVKLHLNHTIQRNKPNLMLKGFDIHRKGGNCYVVYTIGHDSLELLLSESNFVDYAVEIDYPFKSLGASVQLMGSCDGLICLWFHDRHFFCLWNPTTREYKELPKSNVHHHRVYMVAFGFDYKSSDYKLLAYLDGLQQRDNPGTFEVYSLESNSWRTIRNVPYKFPYLSKPSGVLVNGDLHWLAQKENSSSVVLVSLDIGNETFKEMKLPEQSLKKCHSFLNLDVLEGCLCLFVVGQDIGVEVWVMQEYGVQKSWTKRYTVNDEKIAMRRSMNDDYLRLIWSFKNGQILFGGSHIDLRLSNPENNRVTRHNISNGTHLYQEECYFESLVSLKSRTYAI